MIIGNIGFWGYHLYDGVICAKVSIPTSEPVPYGKGTPCLTEYWSKNKFAQYFLKPDEIEITKQRVKVVLDSWPETLA